MKNQGLRQVLQGGAVMPVMHQGQRLFTEAQGKGGGAGYIVGVMQCGCHLAARTMKIVMVQWYTLHRVSARARGIRLGKHGNLFGLEGSAGLYWNNCLRVAAQYGRHGE